jgi:hypothetical protein
MSCVWQIVLLDVVLLRLRRPIPEKPDISLPSVALVTKLGEKYGLTVPLTEEDGFWHFELAVDSLNRRGSRPVARPCG